MKQLGVITLVILTLIFSLISNVHAIELQNVEVNITLVSGDFISSSVEVSISNFPTDQSIELQLVFGPQTSPTFSTSSTFDFSDNVITNAQSWSLLFVTEDMQQPLFEKEVKTGVYLHLRHVYSNWTSGQPPPPDSRGLGVGALIDYSLLNTLLPNSFSSQSEASVLGETILNTLLDEQLDRNGDASIEQVSDGFGTFEYTYGMRDHINNAGKSADADTAISDLATAIVSNLSSSVIDDGNYGTFLTGLNTSSSFAGELYQKSFELLTSNVTHANSLLTDISELIGNDIIPILTKHFDNFRNFVYGTSVTITETIDLSSLTTSSTSDTEDTSFGIPLFYSAISLVVFRKVRK